MADTERKLANGKTRIDFQTDPSRYRHWKLAVDGDVATLTMDVDEKGGLLRRLRAEAQLLRSRRRHRARRRDRAAALRASAGEGRAAALRQAAGVLRRRQYPHAGGRHPCPQGQLLQVHQRDAQRHRGRKRSVGAQDHLRDQRHRRRRRLRAGARRRPHHAGRRRLVGGVAAGTAAAGGAARHRRAHARHRQAQGAARPRRFLLHHRGRHQGQARGRVAAGRRGGAGLEIRRRGEAARAGVCREVAARQRREGHCAHAAQARARRTTRSNTARCRWRSSAPRRLATITLRGPDGAPPKSADEMVAHGAEFWPLRARARA